MPSLRKNNSGSYFLTWSNVERHPRQKSESLKTKKLAEARKRAGSLEQLYNNGYHDSWKTSWFKNDRIKSFVYSGNIDLQQLAGQSFIPNINTKRAIEEYIAH